MTIQQDTLSLPAIDLAPFLEDPSSEAAHIECQKAAESLMKYSCLAIRDPRVVNADHETFLDLLEAYFSLPTEEKMKDVRPELSYQVGATPGLTEVPKCGSDEPCQEFVANLNEQDKPSDYNGPDPKWRFFWRMGERPTNTQFPEQNAAPVVPAAFPQWPVVLNKWGNTLMNAISSFSEMLALGLGLDRSTFLDKATNGPHLLAPTATDLGKYGAVGTVLAGFHYDLNFLTIHGRSRFPGLIIWDAEGNKRVVKIPEGCLLVQAGKQMEVLTGGNIKAGYHEVVVLPQTLDVLERRKEQGQPLWRISSTLFFHLASDVTLKPMSSIEKVADNYKVWKDMKVGEFVKRELGLISLAADN